MNVALVCVFGLVVFGLGYRFYSVYLAEGVFALRDLEAIAAVRRGREVPNG